MNQLIDSQGRPIRYMRVSVTDRCNLRCRYCVPSSEFVSLSHEQIISYEEIERLARILAPRGVSSIRITGGEPLVRKNLDRLVSGLFRTPGVQDVSLTTNGYLLGEMAGQLKKAGLSRVNVSLDTLQDDRFNWITAPNGECGGSPGKILQDIEKASRAGLSPVKINVVLMRGFNDDELAEFADLTRDRDLEVRFIEFMPLSPEGFWGPEKVVTASEAMGRIETLHGSLKPSGCTNPSGPAVCYKIPGYRGTLGFITPISEHFCATCNRIRITADGKIRTCLFLDNETDLTGPMRSGASDEEVLVLIQDALKEKPEGHGLGRADRVRRCARTMSLIGG